jgi:hypothetical protein
MGASLLYALPAIGPDLEAGAIVVMARSSLRVRALPVTDDFAG